MQKFMKALKGKTAALATVASSALVALPAMASGGGGVDITGVKAAIESARSSVGEIGQVVILVFVGIAVYKWVRRAL